MIQSLPKTISGLRGKLNLTYRSMMLNTSMDGQEKVPLLSCEGRDAFMDFPGSKLSPISFAWDPIYLYRCQNPCTKPSLRGS